MTWKNELRKQSGKTIKQFRDLFEPMLDEYLNDNISDENDYTEEKMKELQDEINRGDVLAGMGKYLDIKLSLDDSDGYYVDVKGDGRELLAVQFNLKGKMRRL